MFILKKVSDLFSVSYGVNLELVNLEEVAPGSEDAIFFVSRTENNNGVSAIVRKIDEIEPNPPIACLSQVVGLFYPLSIIPTNITAAEIFIY